MKTLNLRGEEGTMIPGQSVCGNCFTEVAMSFEELLDVFSTERGLDWFRESLMTRFPPSGRLTVNFKGELHG